MAIISVLLQRFLTRTDHLVRINEEKNSLVVFRRQETITTAKQRQGVGDATDKTVEREHQVVFWNFLKLVFNLYVILC